MSDMVQKENDAAKPTPTDILVKETVVSNTVQKENDVARPALTLDLELPSLRQARQKDR